MLHWFTMVSVTMKQILLNVFMMVETVVDLMSHVSDLACYRIFDIKLGYHLYVM